MRHPLGRRRRVVQPRVAVILEEGYERGYMDGFIDGRADAVLEAEEATA